MMKTTLIGFIMLRSCLFLSALTTASIFALPSGHSIKGGSAKVVSQGDQVIITSGKSAVIHWDQFSVGKGETAKFQMQDSKSSVLNRVTGGNKSEILGRMESNGKVYLLNQKGILFGKECQINVGGLVASTLDVLDADYINGGKMLFDGDSNSAIVNLGKISSAGGDIYLLAQKVENSGSIEANHVGLGSGSKILIKPEGSERIFVKAGSSSIDHSGAIKAVVTELKTKSAYEMAINCTGTIEGVRANRINGHIFLNADGGKAFLNSKLRVESGQISVLGEEITLAENAHLDVSSMSGPGGRIDVGLNKEVHSIFVNEGARLDASGKPGGKIYLLAGELQFFGGLKAQGLGSSDGGFAEISSVSDEYIIGQDYSLYDLSSDCGKSGELLFDPGTITIDVSLNAGPCTFGDSYIAGLLGGGTSVTITSAGQTVPSVIACGGAGLLDIVFLGGPIISWGTDAALTLTASRAISGAVTISNTSATVGGVSVISLTGLGAPSLAATENFIGVDLAGSTISTVGQDITITGTGGNSGSLNNGVQGSSTSITSTGGGNIAITGTSAGDAAGSSNRGIQMTGGTMSATGIGTITIDGTGGLGADRNYGSFFTSSGTITVDEGLLSITGTGGAAATGEQNDGILVLSYLFSSTASSGSPGGITFVGNMGTGTDTNNGVRLLPATVTSSAGPIMITGNDNAATTGLSNSGVNCFSGTIVMSTTGDITIVGDGGGTTLCTGVINGGTVESEFGNISITGTGGGGAGALFNRGIFLTGTVVSTGMAKGAAGTITLTGTGG